MSRVLAKLCAFAVAATAAGCVVPPPPSQDELVKLALPNTRVPEKWEAAPADAAPIVQGWLALFRDPVLEGLVADAIAYNADLQIAAARVEAAEAAARAAGAALLPQAALGARGGGKMGGDNTGLSTAGLFASWEIDLWGRVRASRGAAAAQYEGAGFDYIYARNSIAALVAKSWFLAREATLQRALAIEMAAASDSLVGFARERLRIGRGDDLEVAQAEASTFSYRDAALQAERARQEALRAVEILVGRYPGAFLDTNPELQKPGPIPVGLPSELLERRPDVRAAERRVAAAFYRTYEARAARLPKISLSASFNSVTSDLIVLKERDNPIWSLGAGIIAPIFTGGALKAQVDVRSAEQKAAIAEFARIGSRAFSEVENALSASYNLDAREESLLRAVEVNERALGLTRVRLDVGSGDQRGVQTQMIALHTVRATHAHVRAERLIQRVNLHLALGGGFDAAP
jgi:NodT family efflux transporter outer membrane factor (OMF) lipoprotein